MTFWKWSRTAASNSTADASINWAEGQAPSSVNDSARGMMAASAKYRDDLAGLITTGGTSTAYTVTTYQGLTALTNGFMVAFVPHATSGGTTTLAVDGLAAKPLRSAPSTELPNGTLVAGTPYTATYYSSTEEWILHGFYSNPYNIPIGAGIDYWGATAPNSSFVLAYGQAISRTTYSALFAIFSTSYGSGDGSTTFNVPDCRGRVTAKWDSMGGSSGNRLTDQTGGLNGDTLGATGGAETHSLLSTQMPPHNHGGVTGADGSHSHTYSGPTSVSTAVSTGGDGVCWSGQVLTATSTVANHTHTIAYDGGSGGSVVAHNNVQPTIICNYLIRII